MAYTRTWNAAYEASPAGSDLGSTVDNRIRETKQDLRERIAKDHYMDVVGTDADHGEHSKITFQAQSAKPAAVANKGFIYTKDVSAKVELFWEDEDGHEVQITASGILKPFPTGTKMVFFQALAPLGWTQVTSSTDAFLRVVSWHGGGTGGTTSAGTLAHTHTMSAHTHTMDRHNHKWNNYVAGGTDQSYDGDGTAINYTRQTHNGLYLTMPGSAINGHYYTTKVDPGDTNATNPGDTNSTSIAPKYIDVIVCSLD